MWKGNWLNIEFVERSISMWKCWIQRDWSLLISQSASMSLSCKHIVHARIMWNCSTSFVNFPPFRFPLSLLPPSHHSGIEFLTTWPIHSQTAQHSPEREREKTGKWVGSEVEQFSIFISMIESSPSRRSSWRFLSRAFQTRKQQRGRERWAKANELVSRIFYGLSLKLSTSAIILRFLSGRLLSFT